MKIKNMQVFGTKRPTLNSFTAALCAGATFLLAGSAPAQNLYISDDNNFTGTLGEYGLNGAAVNPALITGLGAPDGMAFSGDNLFVANGNSPGSVGEYTASGATVNASLLTPFNSGLPQSPNAVAISGNDLFVVSGAITPPWANTAWMGQRSMPR